MQTEDSIGRLLADPARANEFVAQVDAIGAKYFATVGKKDLTDIRIKSAISKASMLSGRGLIHLGAVTGSIPVVAVGALLFGFHQFMESETLGHDIMHGIYDKLAPPQSRLTSSRFHQPLAFHERGWQIMHNTHHANCGVIGRDPDIGYGILRLNTSVPWTMGHLGMFLFFLITFPFFAIHLSVYSTGVAAHLWEKRTGQRMLREMTPKIVAENMREFASKAFFILAQNLVFFPFLTGEGFWFAVSGYIMACVCVSLLLVFTTLTNHTDIQTRMFSEDEVSMHWAFWMAQQIESSSNINVGFFGKYFLSTLAFQIEHHLFPKMPAPKLAAIAVEIQSLCLEYGVKYHRGALPRLVLESVWRNAYFAIPPVMSAWIGERFPRLRPTG